MNYIPAMYTEVLYNIMNDATVGPMLTAAMSTYPLYEHNPENENEYIPNIIPTRAELNKKILDHYKYREIGFETVARFLDELEIALNEIMPYYNQVFLTQDQDFNIIYNVDYVKTIGTTRSGTASGQTSSSSSGTGYGKSVQTDTPQGQLSILAENIDTLDYASDAGWTKDSSSSSGSASNSSSSSGSESTTESTKGNYGVVSAQDLVMKYRETIVNTVQEIINDPRIQELFMLVY